MLPDEIAAIDRPSPPLMQYYVLKALATTVAFPVTLLLLYFRYHTMRYRFDAEGIHMRWGILIRREVMLNYSRIQDIQLQSNFVERYFGLARIVVQTASGGAGADMTLEGLLNFVEVRDYLYSRMRGSRHLPESGHGASLPAILQDVASELRSLRMTLEPHSSHGRERG